MSKELKKTTEMKKYEKETGKFAIWRDQITEGFKKWKRGEKIYEKDKERVNILLNEETKTNWQEFANDFEYPTFSKFIREAVNFFIKYTRESKTHKPLSKITHELRDILTSIKGYSQIIFENYKDELSPDLFRKINKIYDQSILLENKITSELEGSEIEKAPYDILIVDDEHTTVDLLIDFFEMKGYTCKEISTGIDAINELEKNPPKIILLDIILPDIDGYEVYKRISSIPKLSKIPIFFITAVSKEEVSQKSKEMGAEGYFIKPFQLNKFDILYHFLD